MCTASPTPKNTTVQEDTSEDHKVTDGFRNASERNGKGKGKGMKRRMPMTVDANVVKDICPVRGSEGKSKGKRVRTGYRRGIWTQDDVVERLEAEGQGQR